MKCKQNHVKRKTDIMKMAFTGRFACAMLAPRIGWSSMQTEQWNEEIEIIII